MVEVILSVYLVCLRWCLGICFWIHLWNVRDWDWSDTRYLSLIPIDFFSLQIDVSHKLDVSALWSYGRLCAWRLHRSYFCYTAENLSHVVVFSLWWEIWNPKMRNSSLGFGGMTNVKERQDDEDPFPNIIYPKKTKKQHASRFQCKKSTVYPHSVQLYDQFRPLLSEISIVNNGDPHTLPFWGREHLWSPLVDVHLR